MLKVSLLGDFHVSYQEVSVTAINTARLQSLLAYLLLHRGAPQSRAHLAFLFWPDTSEAQARSNLRNLLHTLRRTLPDCDSYLDIRTQTIQWRCDSQYQLDVADFEAQLALAKQAQAGNNLAGARARFDEIVERYRGDLLSSCYDDWVIPHRERLHQAYIDALDDQVKLLEDARDYQAAIHIAQILLSYDPLSETAYRQLMRLFALHGDRAGALRAYHTCSTVLQRELEVQPSEATRKVYEQLIGSDGVKDEKTSTTPIFSPLVGRQHEWLQLLHAWRMVSTDGKPHIVFLRGDAGIGKTRMVEELLQWAIRQGISNASTRCYSAEGDLAYTPVLTWLRSHPPKMIEDIWFSEVARIMPELLAERPDLARPAPLVDAWQRQHLFEALSRAILKIDQPVLLTIDDLQWCDRDTLEWLHYLLRYDPAARLLVIGSYRPDEIGERHPLAGLLQVLRIEGQITEIDLQPLDLQATHSLAGMVANMEISADLAQRIFQETEGNPLFVIETVRAGMQSQASSRELFLTVNTKREGLNLPPKVQSILERRLAQVSHPTRDLAGLAATIGREFSFNLLVEACHEDEKELVQQLDELWQRRIIREHGADAYDFSHDKLREVTYFSMSAAQRRLNHQLVAHALEKLHADELDSISHQLAAHYERAGSWHKAIPFYLRAAKLARQVYANDEAINLLMHGLTLADDRVLKSTSRDATNSLCAQMREEMGDIYELTARHDEALQAYQKALEQIQSEDWIGNAHLLRNIGVVKREQRKYHEALAASRQAEIELERLPGGDNYRWWEEWLEIQVEKVWAYYWLSQWPEMEELIRNIQPVVEKYGKPNNRMRYHLAYVLLHLRKERYIVSDEMMAASREALEISSQFGDMKAKTECSFELGFLYLWRFELEAAEHYLHDAQELAELAGILPMQTLSLTYLTVAARLTGHVDKVRHLSQRAFAMAEAAQMPDYIAAAESNQAWLAWRRYDKAEAEEKCLEALKIWQQSPLVYPFQWQAIWILIAIAHDTDRDDNALTFIETLLAPTQQLLEGEIDKALQNAIQHKGNPAATRMYTEQAISLAGNIGYL